MRGTKRKRGRVSGSCGSTSGKDPVTGKYRADLQDLPWRRPAADDALRDLVDKQAPRSADGFGATFGQLLDRWLEECERLDLSPTTLRTYRSQIEQTIRPALGQGGAHPTDRQASRRPLRGDEGRGPVAEDDPQPPRHHLVGAAPGRPVGMGADERRREGEAAPGVASAGSRPRPSRSSGAVIEAAEERDPRLAPLLMLAALTGMRRGELCALRWTDVDLERRGAGGVPVGGRRAGRARREGAPRRTGLADVALDEVGVALLIRHRAQVDEWARAG